MSSAAVGQSWYPPAPVRAARWRTALSCNPVHDLQQLDVQIELDLTSWRAIDTDPQFVIELPTACQSGGWFLFEIAIKPVVGRLSMPCLYVDNGQGFAQQDCTLLDRDNITGMLRSVVNGSRGLIRLRLDPSNRCCEFMMGAATLTRLGRMEVALIALADAQGGRTAPILRTLLDSDLAVLDLRLNDLLAESTAMTARHASADALGYADWIETCERFGGGRQTTQAVGADDGASDGSCTGPLISVLVPVYNTPVKLLQCCIDSVLVQTYSNWELCIADDASDSVDTLRMLRSLMRVDRRIHVVFRKHNGHISAASNSALALVNGDYVALLDHDDELHPAALQRIAEAIASHPQACLIYTDEDKIEDSNVRFDPYFKPDWNPDLMLGHNFISHLGVYRTEMVREVGGFREGYEGSQDYDLALRCIERLQPDQIHHVPHVLYHWRATAGSTALTVSQKGYAAGAALRAISDHLRRSGIAARVSLCETSQQYRVQYAVPSPAPLVSLIVPTRDQVGLLSQCIDGLLHRTDYRNIEILIVDNQSTDRDALAYLTDIERDPRVRVLRYDAAFNYPAINNFAARQASGTLIGLINNDIDVIDADWLDEMVAQACRHGIGAVGAKLYYGDGTIQHAGVILGIHGVAAHPYSKLPGDTPGYCNRARLVQNLSAVTAACLIVKKSLYDEVGGLDEALAVAFNDVDFCLRIRANGYRNLWTPYARLRHLESVSRGAEDTPEKRERFSAEVAMMLERWGSALTCDPAYNPNLTLNGEPFSLNFDL